MKENKTRYICDLTFCRHINTENICTIGNQENCVYYRTLQALNGYKENAKWCDDCRKIKELEQKNHAMLVNSLKICNQSEIDNDENERKIAELEAQIEKMKCCGNCQKLRGRFDSKTNINILYCSDSDMKQIEVGFQMCCCKWEIKEND